MVSTFLGSTQISGDYRTSSALLTVGTRCWSARFLLTASAFASVTENLVEILPPDPTTFRYFVQRCNSISLSLAFVCDLVTLRFIGDPQSQSSLLFSCHCHLSFHFSLRSRCLVIEDISQATWRSGRGDSFKHVHAPVLTFPHFPVTQE